MTRRRTPRRPSTIASRRRPRGRALLPLLAVVPLALPAAADARTVRSNNVSAFSDNGVSCLVVRQFKGVPNQGIECSSQAVPRKELDGYVELHRTGRSKLGERGDFPGYSGKATKLKVGDVWRPGHSAKGIRCEFESQGLRCKNRSGHGFVIEPEAFRRF
ncbi:hypothetical protein [Patulibacter minatonensis]|uniref:hypothetical protein n=1 Tax=Patulibacter minatonensis TaxID=298163 RepID=UPI00055CD1D3|nr:hypothetical protein [Patulibacter minatonensis]